MAGKYVSVLLVLAIRIERSLRLVSGRDAKPEEYPYVLSLHVETPGILAGANQTVYIRFCSGTLITPTWVLTAAHCFVDDKLPAEFIRVRFGDRTKPLNETDSLRKALKTVPHPGYFPHKCNSRFVPDVNPEDIALMQTEEVPIQPGRLSAIEYKSLTGLPVIYAGYGFSKSNAKVKALEYLTSPKRLHIGEGGIIPCDRDTTSRITRTTICVVAKCHSIEQLAHQADSGGPLFFKDHIIGIASVAHLNNVGDKSRLALYTPVSPYLDWIYSVIH